MSRLYTYFVTSAPGGATQNALRCKLARGSDLEYLVCLKKSCIDVYSLEKVDGSAAAGASSHRSGGPVLTASVKAHTNLLTFAEYRPPGCDKSHLLVVTSNLVLLLLSFDEEASKFTTRPLLALQEPNGQDLETDVILRVDPNFNLILFHGQKKTLKCIMLDHADYFLFNHVITMRTGETMFMDFVFVDSGYRVAGAPSPDDYGSPTTPCSYAPSPIRFKCDRHGRYILECRLLLITANSLVPEGDAELPEFWYSGIELFFEIEFSGAERTFHAYGCAPSFGDPMILTKQFTKFLSLKLNPGARRYDSVLLLGCQALGFISIRDPKNIKVLHTDISIGEIRSYCTIEENKRYIIGDDTGALYLLDLVTSNTTVKNALKRRAGTADTANTAAKVSNAGTYNTVVDIVVTKIGVYSPPTALVRLAPDLIYIATSVGNCRTVRINGLGSLSEEGALEVDVPGSRALGVEAAETWRQINLGPIMDFTFGARQEHGPSFILACCGYGSEGRVCSIALGIGIDVFAAHTMDGVRNIFVVESPQSTPDVDEIVMCCVFFNCSRFFKVTIPEAPKTTEPGRTAIDLSQQGDWVVTRIQQPSYGFVENERTLLFTKLDATTLLQVTSGCLIAFDTGPTSHPPVKLGVEDICRSMGATEGHDTRIAYATMCDNAVFLLLSDQHILMVKMEGSMQIICWRKLSKQISACAFIRGDEVKRSNGRGLLALSTWEGSELYILHPDTLDVVLQTEMLCGFGIAILALRFSVMGEAVYLFAALSDGTLVLHRLHFGGSPTAADSSTLVEARPNDISLVLRSVHKINDGVIGLAPLNVSGDPGAMGSCRLSSINLVTTGANPTLVYANKGKIEYIRINVPRISSLCGIPTARSQSCFGIPLVYISGKNQLCVGELDTVGQLHVDTICSGRSFDKICYHHESDLVVVGCVGELLAHSESCPPDLGPDPGVETRGTVFRCLNGESAKCLPGMSMLDACAKFISLKTKEVIHTLRMPPRHLVSSISTVSFDGHRTMIAIGTSRVSELEDMPLEGHIFLVDIVSSSIDMWEIVLLRTVTPLSAGIVEMTACTNALVVALNDSIVVMTLRRDDTPSLSHSQSSNKKTHKLETMHASDDNYGQYSLVERAEYVACTYVVSLDSRKDIIVVGDLLNSVRILRWKGNDLKELSKDFNSMYCTAVAAVDKNRCIASDSSGNLCVFAKVETVTNDRQALRVEEIGLFHHGENINKIRMNPTNEGAPRNSDVANSREMPEFLTQSHCSRTFCCSQIRSKVDTTQVVSADVVRGLTKPNKFWNYQFRDVFTCATSAGSLIQLCLFEDDKLFYRLSMLEEAINSVQAEVGNIANRHWRTFKNKWVMTACKGFIDGDVVESFLELDPGLRQRIFEDLRRNDMTGFFYSPELLVLEIEYIKRLRR